MSLTHDEIKAMTCEQVNVAIAERLSYPDFDGYPDYCHDWSSAGRLLEELVSNSIDKPFIIDHWFYADQNTGEKYPAYAVQHSGAVIYDNQMYPAPQIGQGHTLTEAIARCWLEWYEVTHEEAE